MTLPKTILLLSETMGCGGYKICIRIEIGYTGNWYCTTLNT